MKASISVIVPHFRRADVIGETLMSVFSQTLPADEIIVVDDHSNDGSLEALRAYEPRIRIVALEKNQGVSHARNVGVNAAHGDYIAFIDSDDLWEVTKLEKQLAYLTEHPDHHAVHTGCVNFYPCGKELAYINKPSLLAAHDLIRSSHVMFQSVMMRRDTFLDAGGFDPSFRQTEDYEFSMRLVSRGTQIGFIPEALTRVRHGRADKLSTNWTGYIRGHVKVVLRYESVFRRHEGWFGPTKHTAKYIMKGGMKRGGLIGKSVYLGGRLLWPKGL